MARCCIVLFAGLASIPLFMDDAAAQLAPTVSVRPSPNRSYDAFQRDEYACRQYAGDQVEAAEQPPPAAAPPANPLVGAMVGAGVGAAIGGGRGAATGAASGATGVPVGAPRLSRAEAQQRYDYAFSQCMSSRGYEVAGFDYRSPPSPAPPASYSYQPPAPSYSYQSPPTQPPPPQPPTSYSYQSPQSPPPAPPASAHSYQPPSTPPAPSYSSPPAPAAPLSGVSDAASNRSPPPVPFPPAR
jgi:hypothetical protein